MPPASIPSNSSQTRNSGRESRPRGAYKRAYKACELCRKNKAKCEVEPGATACIKCHREQRQCVFPLERSSKRPRTSESQDGTSSHRDDTHAINESDSTESQVPLHDGGLAATTSTQLAVEVDSQRRQSHDEPHMTLHGQAAMIPATRDDSSLAANLTTDVVQTFVTSSQDAMGLLFKAAAHDSDESPDTDVETMTSKHARREGSDTSPSTTPGQLSGTYLPTELSHDTVELWDNHRFVRQGWFTAHEAISYIEL